MPTLFVTGLEDVGAWILYLVIGVGFGFVLEQSGFGNSKMLAGQFYFRNMRVLKVMFTAIITAMLLIFLSSALGLLDIRNLWINPSFLWPDIVGGLIMGVGFVIGGYCPGTSLVSMVTGKLDGIVFVLGVMFGILVFGESVDQFTSFWISSAYGSVTLQGFFGVPVGVVIIGVIIMALGMFKGGELLEDKFGKYPQAKLPHWASLAFIIVALLIWGLGQPDLEQRWEWVQEKEQPKIDQREIFISSLEIAKLKHDDRIELRLWDYRDDQNFNVIHFPSAQRMQYANLDEYNIEMWKSRPGNAVFMLIGDDEDKLITEWKRLRALGLHNVYIMDQGMGAWVKEFHHHAELNENPTKIYGYDLEPIGGNHKVLHSNREWIEHQEVPSKVKLQIKQGPGGGGCG